MKALLQQPTFRQILATWLALYPLLTITLWTFERPLTHLSLPVRTLVLTVFLVPMLGYVLVPWSKALLDRWIPVHRCDTDGRPTVSK